MSKNICHYLLIGLYSFVFSSGISLARLEFQTGIDRSKLSSRHLQVHKEFIEKNFKKDRRYDLEKTKKFLERLEDEKRNIISDVSETKILEEVELYIKKPHKARKKWKKPEKLAKEELSITLNQYLIPKIKKLIAYIETGASERECEALVSDFIRGYAHFYIPNAHRSIFPFDVDFEHAAVHILKRFDYHKNDFQKIEAVNLQVEKKDLTAINRCLKHQVHVGHFLTRRETRTLKTLWV